MAVVAPGSEWVVFEVNPGDTVFGSQGVFHSIENAGHDTLKFLLVFNADTETDIGIGIGASLGAVPNAALAPSLEVPESALTGFPKIHQQDPIIAKRTGHT